MEVSGRKGSSDPVISCQPCQGDGDTVQAEGYCENCNQFICSSCIKAHRKLPVTKNHVIKSKDEMPKVQTVQSNPCTELCDVHKNEIVKFYCEEHDGVGCGDCMVLEHISCKVQLVPDVSCNYDDSDELVLIKHRIEHLKKNLDACKRQIRCSLKSSDEIKISITKEIKQFRKEMDTYLDKVTKDLIEEVEKLSAGDVCRQQKLHDQCKATTEDIENIQRRLEQCRNNVNDLFVSSKRAHKKLQSCQEINEEISAKSQINTVKFSPTEDLIALKVQNTRLGDLNTRVKKITGPCEKSIIDLKANFVQQFNMWGKKDRKCHINGMTIISEDEILYADPGKCSLKIFNYKESKITSTLKTSCYPVDVTTINSSSAATTLSEEGKILFLNTQNGLTISRSIKVRENCEGIDYHGGIMAVTFRDTPAVHVIDMEGHILHKVKDSNILKWPSRICLSNDGESMFVTDPLNGGVYEFTIQGHLKNSIITDELKEPVGITITNCGSLVVCDLDKSDNVNVIVPGAKQIIPLYVKNIQMPRDILICEEQRKIFISEYYLSEDANYIKMFDLK